MMFRSGPAMQVDTSNWSGDGEFTATLLEALKGVAEITLVRVEDAPAGHVGTGYSFITNDIYVRFATRRRVRTRRVLGLVSLPRRVRERAMTLESLEVRLTEVGGVGRPDYRDEGMMQFLRAERIIGPYQTRGYKRVELVRVYEIGARAGAARD